MGHMHGAWWVRLNVILSNIQHLFWLAVFSRWHGIYCHSIDPQSTFHWHSIDTSFETPLTSRSTVGRYLTNFLLMRVSRSTLNCLSTNCWSNVDWCRTSDELGMLIMYQSRCRLRVLIVSIDQQLTRDAFNTHNPPLWYTLAFETREKWSELLMLVNCTIISEKRNDDMIAFLLR